MRPPDAPTSPSDAASIDQLSVFLCYRRSDGSWFAEQLYQMLEGAEFLDSDNHQRKVSVYYDQIAPAVGDWKSLHFPSLQSAKALVVVCTPGIAKDFSDRKHSDWVYEELRWWVRNRSASPIVVDTTGEGDRWIPTLVAAKWPNANRIDLTRDRLESGQPALDRVRERILAAVREHERRTVFEDLEKSQRQQRRLKIAFSVALTLLVFAGLAAFAAIRAERRANAQTQLLSEKERGRDLAERGWGILFQDGAQPELRQRLGRLLQHRQAVAGPRYLEMVYRPGESAEQLLMRYGAYCCPSDPVPYYILIAASPKDIPFSLQYDLSTHRAVGRITFDAPHQYNYYADTVVDAELNSVTHAATALVFAPTHEGDRATALSATRLVQPLVESFRTSKRDWTPYDWSLDAVTGSAATKAELTKHFRGSPTPAIAFIASHGLSLKSSDPKQRSAQGAILCSDWGGFGRVTPEMYFAAVDLDGDADYRGTIVFAFGAYSAGTHATDDFSGNSVASEPFVSQLSMALLGSRRGALALIGHVGRAWAYSFDRRGNEVDGSNKVTVGLFANTLRKLMNGYTVGVAIDSFRREYAFQISSVAELLAVHKLADPTAATDPRTENARTAAIDLRNYVIIGDPAVTTGARLNVSR